MPRLGGVISEGVIIAVLGVVAGAASGRSGEGGWKLFSRFEVARPLRSEAQRDSGGCSGDRVRRYRP